MSKKAITFLVAALLCFSITTPSLADDTSAAENAWRALVSWIEDLFGCGQEDEEADPAPNMIPVVDPNG